MSECYCMLENVDKALKIVNTAYERLRFTNYEGEIKLAEAQIFLYKKDFNGALKILNAIKPDQSIFIKVGLTYVFILMYVKTLFKYHNF